MPANTTSDKSLIHTKPSCRAWSLALGLLVLSLVPVHADGWSTPQFILGDSDVSTGGISVWAYHFTFNSLTSATVNGVTFEAAPYNGGGFSNDLAFDNPGALWAQDMAFSGTLPAYASLGTEYQTVLQGGAYWTAGGGTIALNSLDPGQEYQLQFWVQDAREGFLSEIIGRTDLLDDGAGNTVSVKYNDGVSTNGSLGQHVFYTFTATSSTELINVNPGPGGSADTAQVNAMQLRAVPEPSVCLLLMGGGTILLWRKRRRYHGRPGSDQS